MCFTAFKYHELFFVGVIKNCVHVLTRKHVFWDHFRVEKFTVSDLVALGRDQACARAWTCFLTPALHEEILMFTEEIALIHKLYFIT